MDDGSASLFHQVLHLFVNFDIFLRVCILSLKRELEMMSVIAFI